MFFLFQVNSATAVHYQVSLYVSKKITKRKSKIWAKLIGFIKNHVFNCFVSKL